MNRRFQDLVGRRYPEWVAGEPEQGVGVASSLTLPLFPTSPVLTSQFLARCLKLHWDPQTERAALFIFDGMRYEIWDELLKPLLLERLELVAELMGSSLIPSETQLTRKAISAGTFPDTFDSRSGEDQLLKSGLARELGYTTAVATAAPEGAGAGETVRFRAGNLDVYIFELCDRELHHVKLKTLPDGRVAPSRSLAFIYEQHIKNILDTEVAAIFRGIAPGTKVFVTADHGFGPVKREQIWFDAADLNEQDDCSYLNCWLKVPFGRANLPANQRANVIAFTPEQIRMPNAEVRSLGRGGGAIHKDYRSIVFPRVGYAFSRSGSPFDPDAYSHGGISVQELLIPMAVLKVKARDSGSLKLDSIDGPAEVVEGEEVTFRFRLTRAAGPAEADEPRVDLEASYGRGDWSTNLPHQVVYVPPAGRDVLYRFQPDATIANAAERQAGVLKLSLTIAASYREGYRTVRRTVSKTFAVRLRSDQVVRRVGNLGGILGLMPRSIGG